MDDSVQNSRLGGVEKETQNQHLYCITEIQAIPPLLTTAAQETSVRPTAFQRSIHALAGIPIPSDPGSEGECCSTSGLPAMMMPQGEKVFRIRILP